MTWLWRICDWRGHEWVYIGTSDGGRQVYRCRDCGETMEEWTTNHVEVTR